MRAGGGGGGGGSVSVVSQVESQEFMELLQPSVVDASSGSVAGENLKAEVVCGSGPSI